MKTKKYWILAVLSLVALVAGCNGNSGHLSYHKQQAIECAKNWKTQGYYFEPNSITCSQMFQKVQDIRRAEFWREKGYLFDPRAMTRIEMDQKVKDIDRAKYWRERGHCFDPNSMTAREMDLAAKELDKAQYWKETMASSYKRGGIHPKTPEEGFFGNLNQPAAVGQWQVFETTSIDGWVKKVKRGNILKTTSGNIYEVVDVVILFEMEVRPDVTVLTDGHFYKLFIRGVDEPLLCKKLNRGKEGTAIPTEQTYINTGSGHWIHQNIYAGSYIKLEDNSLWEVSPIDRIYSILWLPTSEITVVEGGNPYYSYFLINIDDNEKVEAKLISN